LLKAVSTIICFQKQCLLRRSVYLIILAPRVECKPGYLYNPFSTTCVRIVNINQTWNGTKQWCGAAGEHMLVFETADEIAWFNNARESYSG